MTEDKEVELTDTIDFLKRQRQLDSMRIDELAHRVNQLYEKVFNPYTTEDPIVHESRIRYLESELRYAMNNRFITKEYADKTYRKKTVLDKIIASGNPAKENTNA